MPIPSYEEIMAPLLKTCSDGVEHRFSQLVDRLAEYFQLSEAERAELLPGGTQARFRNRVGWARSYLVQAALLRAVKRGVVQITARGMQAVQSDATVNNDYLIKFPEFQEFRARSSRSNSLEHGTPNATGSVAKSATPEEELTQAYEELRTALVSEVHELLLASTPEFFERVVVDLLQAMGYGGTRKDAAILLGKSGDGGVDGAIKEDKLGLDTIYVQAKKWAADRPAGNREIRDFIGALQLNSAHKGVFFTTSVFSAPAKDAASRAQSRVVLIDGQQLSELMVEHGVGVSTSQLLPIRKVDSDYFED